MGATNGKAKKPSSIKVYYWGPHGDMKFYGRAIAIYLTLDQAGVPYDKINVKDPGVSSRFAALDPNSSNESDPPKAYAPPLVEIDGDFMGQTPGILALLGEMFELLGKTPAEKMQTLHALGDVQDVFDLHGKFETDASIKGKWLGYLDKKLEGKKWMGGTQEPTVADFHGVFAFCWVVGKNIDFSNYSNLTQWWRNIKEVPVVAKMLASCTDEGGLKMVPV